jgi:hypothetical protein
VSIGGIGSVPGLLALGVLRLVRLDVLAKVGLLSLHRKSVFSVVVRKRYRCSRVVRGIRASRLERLVVAKSCLCA